MRHQTRPALTVAAILIAAMAQISCSESAPSNLLQEREESPVTVVSAARVTRANIASKTVLTAEFQPFQEVDVMAKVAGYVRVHQGRFGRPCARGSGSGGAGGSGDERMRSRKRRPWWSKQVRKSQPPATSLQRAESSHQIAHLSYTRLQDVIEAGARLIPQQELDEVRSQDLVAEAQLAAAQSKLRVEQNKTRVAKAEETRASDDEQLCDDHRAVRWHRHQALRQSSGR